MPNNVFTPQLTEVMNKARANWALQAVNLAAGQLGAESEDLSVKIIDLICNLQHLCRREEIDFDEVLRAGRVHFEEETCG